MSSWATTVAKANETTRPGVGVVGVDPLEWWPLGHPVREKLQRLRQLKDDAYQLMSPISEQRAEQIGLRSRAQNRLRQLREDVTVRDDHPEIASAAERITRADAELARLNALYEARSAAWQEAGQLLDRAEEYLRAIASPPGLHTLTSDQALREITIAPRTSVQLKKGELLPAAVETRRRRLRELDADRHRVDSAPIPSADAKAIALAEIDALAEHGRPDLLSTVEHGAKVKWPRSNAHTTASPGASPSTVVHSDGVSLLAWMFRDQLKAAVSAEIDALADDGAALNDGERRKLREQIGADMLAVAREEEALIEAAAAEGIAIHRRASADARAVLGIEGPDPETI